jgi:putative SOS response-associated peptidase YedK
VCGRYWLVTPSDVLASRFHVRGERAPLVPRWNAAPGQDLPVVRLDPKARGARVLEPMRWGLVPSWATDPEDAGRPINARAETAATKPSFKEPFRRRRALVPADGFFEWKKGDRGREPFAIRLKSRQTFAFAGLFDEWTPRGGAPVRTFAILTTRPNALVGALHDRMPVILSPEGEDLWLDAGIEDAARLAPLFEPPDAAAMEAFPVSRHVNAPAHDDPSVLDPPSE